MSYRVTLKHINQDFTFEPIPEGSWSDEIADDEGLIFLMNRVAVAASQHPTVDFPEIDINYYGKRVTLTVVHGQLVYNDAHKVHCQNLKVIPDEVIRLLQDKPLDQVFINCKDEEARRPKVRYKHSKTGPFFTLISLGMMVGSLYWAAAVYQSEFGQEERLYEEPSFMHQPSLEASKLEQYNGVYVLSIQEGGLLFRINLRGTFELFEMWRSNELKTYQLVQKLSLPMQGGFHEGKFAFLAGRYYLLIPTDTDGMLLHNLEFQRSDEPLSSFGKLVDESKLIYK